MSDTSEVVMHCTTHGAVVPEADVVMNDENQRVVEWHCPQCGEHLGEFIDGGLLSVIRTSGTDMNRNTAFDLFFENFETITNSGCVSLRAHMRPLTRRELIWRHFRTRLSIRPRWKTCVPISCPDVEEIEISGSWTQHDPS